MSAADAVGHFDLRHIKVLRARAEGLASHSVLEEGCGGDVGWREPEGDVGACGFLLIGGFGLHLALPLDEFFELLFVVLTKIATNGLYKV